MTNLADLQTERERLHAAEAKTAFEAALAETCDAKDMLAAALAVRKLILSAIDAAAVDFVSAIAGERDETRVHYLLSEAAHQIATGLGERAAKSTPGLPELGASFRPGAMLRAGIERVIDQTAPRLAAASNDLERRIILDKEIRRLRWMMKREIPRALRRMKSDQKEAR